MALLRSESFNQQYIKYCKTFFNLQFLCVGLQARMDKSLDLRRILSADCIAAASGVKFNEFEGNWRHLRCEPKIRCFQVTSNHLSGQLINSFYS